VNGDQAVFMRMMMDFNQKLLVPDHHPVLSLLNYREKTSLETFVTGCLIRLIEGKEISKMNSVNIDAHQQDQRWSYKLMIE
jgi:hypothetical protein